jgi:hypothetical protein
LLERIESGLELIILSLWLSNGGIHGEGFLELIQLLSLYPALHILHILPQLDLQVLKL